MRRLLGAIALASGIRCPAVCDGAPTVAPDLEAGWCARACRHQASVTAGTILDKTRTPLTTWFEAAWHVTTAKNGLSAKTLERTLGTTYRAAWTMLQRYRVAMVRTERERLSGNGTLTSFWSVASSSVGDVVVHTSNLVSRLWIVRPCACRPLVPPYGLVGWDKRTVTPTVRERTTLYQDAGCLNCGERRPTRIRVPLEKPRIPCNWFLTRADAPFLEWDVDSGGPALGCWWFIPQSGIAAFGSFGRAHVVRLSHPTAW